MGGPDFTAQRIALEAVTQQLVDYFGEQPVLIWSGEHRAWWGFAAAGYYTTRSSAGRYSLSEAWRLTRHCDPDKQIMFEKADDLPIACDGLAPFFLVWSPTGDRPPRYRHAGLRAAELEADRLAMEKPGAEFYVLEPRYLVSVGETKRQRFESGDEVPF